MMNAVVVLLVFCSLWNDAQAFSSNAADCCLSTSDALVPRRILESYKILTVEDGCPIPATVFITKKNKKLCSPPTYDPRYPWVMKLVEFLDNRSGKSKGAQ
ncbi:C-C motif chemokine 19a.2 [Neoarius graeffei]|uniref:C-C motif chemokine 19a.2 n=1 Tax=Neoarius graeffei TaxID=443677 RepID=UPI00298D1E7C|nr:C-C motif chemokine 19a.2 [Neoarius graeffei]